MGYAIKTEGLTKTYKDKVAVDGLTLSVYEGELIALLGVNGAGKTTTVRMLTCLTNPTGGRAEILGHDDNTYYPLHGRGSGAGRQDRHNDRRQSQGGRNTGRT